MKQNHIGENFPCVASQYGLSHETKENSSCTHLQGNMHQKL